MKRKYILIIPTAFAAFLASSLLDITSAAEPLPTNDTRIVTPAVRMSPAEPARTPDSKHHLSTASQNDKQSVMAKRKTALHNDYQQRKALEQQHKASAEQNQPLH